jgi:hypothetical protein
MLRPASELRNIHGARAPAKVDEREALFADAGDADLNVKSVASTVFGNHTTRQDVEVQKAFEHALQRCRVSLGEHPQAQNLNRFGTHKS